MKKCLVFFVFLVTTFIYPASSDNNERQQQEMKILYENFRQYCLSLGFTGNTLRKLPSEDDVFLEDYEKSYPNPDSFISKK